MSLIIPTVKKTIQQQHKFPLKTKHNSNKESNDKKEEEQEKKDIIDITIVFVCL